MKLLKKGIVIATTIGMFLAGITAVHAQSIRYEDVADKDWFSPYVNEMSKNGFMTGMEENRFGPYEMMSRAHFVTTLHRMDGIQSYSYGEVFPDVFADQWYTDAVLWAAENKIVSGYEDGCFGPDDCITREQIAVMLYAYAHYKGFDLTVNTDGKEYPDWNHISDFAKKAIWWCVNENILRGDNSGNLNPTGLATRAECAAILCRFAYAFDIGSKSGEYIADYADQFVGNPYAWGGNDLQNGIDCSHFIYQVLKNCNVYDGGYLTCKQWEEKGVAVDGLENAKAGDVICYYGHIAFYDGNGGIIEAKGSKWGITHDRSAEFSKITAIRRFVE